MYSAIHLEKLQAFFSKYETVEFKKSEVVIGPGDTHQFIYYIESGYVKLYSLSWNGQELILNIFPPNTYFYVLFPSSTENKSYYFSAMTPVVCKRAPRAEAVAYVKKHPEIVFQLLEKVHQLGIEGLYNRMESLVFGNTRSKIAAVLLMLAERFGKKIESSSKTLIELPLTHKDLASLAGITRETTTHEMIKLKKEQFIEVREKNIVLNSIELMKKISLII